MTLAVWVGCCARRRKAPRRCRRESSCDLAREEHDARDAPPRMCAALCSVAGGDGRGPTAGGRARAHNAERDSLVQLARPALVQLGGLARAASGPVAGRVAPPCRRVTLAVWVGCCARRRESHRRRRRESSGDLAREEQDAHKARSRRCGCVLGGWEGRDVARSHGGRRPRAGARTMQCETRACSWAARVRRVPLPGAWLLLVDA